MKPYQKAQLRYAFQYLIFLGVPIGITAAHISDWKDFGKQIATYIICLMILFIGKAVYKRLT